MNVAHLATTSGTEKFQCMFVSYTIGVADGHKYRHLYCFYFLRPIIWFQIDADHLLHKFREMRRIIPQTIILLLYWCAFKHLGLESTETGLYFRPPSVVRIGA